ncbi:MAG: GNAT family N-acetyltransferase [Myxococcota bacterium]
MSALRVRALRERDRAAALAYLDRAPLLNLTLADLVLRLGEARPVDAARPEVLGAWRGRELAGVAGLAPSVMFDASAEREVLDAFFPHLVRVGSGLVKSTEEVVAPLEAWLAAQGRRVLLDRIEIGFALAPEHARLRAQSSDLRVRDAELGDLDDLVEAARQSLLEEDRPDPSEHDPVGFRRWVRGRVSRAVVVEHEGRLGFVGYADVRSARGWLLQGVFTWPALRRGGFAAAGVSELCRRAFAGGSAHVQLAVIEGNQAAERLYEGLGFRRFARLRTLLFS